MKTMKKNTSSFKKYGVLSFLSLALFGMLFLASCDNEEEIPLPPSVSLSSTTAAGVPGTVVSTTVTITAPGGVRTLAILKNGAPNSAFPNQTFNDQASATYTLQYTIEELAVGTVVNFTFVATDARNQSSSVSTFAVTVTAVPPKPIVEVSGYITGDVTWSSDNIYRLNGFVRVGKDERDPSTQGPAAGTTGILRIQPGTIIIGDRETKGTLIVQRTGQIFALGEANNPIIMTSERDPVQREPGDWGGLVICGRAYNNNPGGTEAGTEPILEGNYGGFHGGTDDNHNSGTIQYIRIEFAGIPINPNQEVNSLTMGSLGRATRIDYVMCSFGLDDAFEWFGGTINSKYIIAYRGLDDDFDVDNGWTGNVQYALSIRGASLADQSGSNGFEVDNNSGGTETPIFTSGKFSNVTVVGPKKDRETAISLQFQSAAQLRRNSALSIYNSFFTAYPNGILIDGAGTVAQASRGALVLRNNILAGVDNWGGNGFGSAGTIFPDAPANGANHPNAPRGVRVIATQALGGANFVNGVYTFTPLTITVGSEELSGEEWFLRNNTILPKWQDAGISPTLFDNAITPTVIPNTGSPLLSGANFDGLPEFFDRVEFKGAFGATDWTQGWAEWNPQFANYTGN